MVACFWDVVGIRTGCGIAGIGQALFTDGGKTERSASVLVQAADFSQLVGFVPSTMYFVSRVLILDSEMA